MGVFAPGCTGDLETASLDSRSVGLETRSSEISQVDETRRWGGAGECEVNRGCCGLPTGVRESGPSRRERLGRGAEPQVLED